LKKALAQCTPYRSQALINERSVKLSTNYSNMTRYALKVEGSIPGFNTNLSIELDPKRKVLG
jgi:hypothetical protein